MIYLHLFLTFLEIGAVSFGGGYAMIPLIKEKVLAFGWMSEEELLNAIAISESTPGPIAVNVATLVGSQEAGILGALLATLGVVLPSFIIILIIAALIANLMKLSPVKAFLSGIRPCVVALILGTALTLGLGVLFGVSNVSTPPSPDLVAILIFVALLAVGLLSKLLLKKKPSPILMILLSAVLGMALYSI